MKKKELVQLSLNKMWIISAEKKKTLFETKAEEIFQWLKSDDIPENLRKGRKKKQDSKLK